MHFLTPEEVVEPAHDAELEQQLQLVQLTAVKATEATNEWEMAKARLVQMLTERDLKSAYLLIEGRLYKTTVVTGERIKVDEEALRQRLGARLFNRCTVRKFDKSRFESLLVKGEIDQYAVGDLVAMVPNKVFPKITEVEATAL